MLRGTPISFIESENKKLTDIMVFSQVTSQFFFSVLIILKIFSGGLNTEDEEEMPSRKRRRSQSSSSDSINIVSPSAGTQTPRVTYSTAASSSSGMSPVKITISKSPQTRPQVTASSQAQKVRHNRFWHSVKKSLYR